jgi:hypothetical protein
MAEKPNTSTSRQKQKAARLPKGQTSPRNEPEVIFSGFSRFPEVSNR